MLLNLINQAPENCRIAGLAPFFSINEGFGKFAWLTDPDGNKIELWEPIEERVENA